MKCSVTFHNGYGGTGTDAIALLKYSMHEQNTKIDIINTHNICSFFTLFCFFWFSFVFLVVSFVLKSALSDASIYYDSNIIIMMMMIIAIIINISSVLCARVGMANSIVEAKFHE